MLVNGVIASLLVLPSCLNDTKTSQDDVLGSDTKTVLTGQVLASMKGRPIVTTDSFASEKEVFLNAFPQFRQLLPVMDAKEVDRTILDQVISWKTVDEYVRDSKLDQTEAYKKDLADALKNVIRGLQVKHLMESMPISVSDAEVREFYEANKDAIPGIAISQGGVAATGIEFADEAAARSFMTTAKTSPGGFKKAAQDAGLNAKIKDFKLVNTQSMGVDPQLRDKIVAIKAVPTIELFQVDGTFWIVNATAKEEAKYRPFDQIKDPLKKQVEQTKRMEMLQQKLNELKDQYKIQINEEYFAPAAAPQQEQVPATRGGVAQSSDRQEENAEQRLA